MHDHTKPGSPEDVVLQHYGVKGMRWGHRKQEETSGRVGGRSEEEHRKLVESIVGTPPTAVTGRTTSVDRNVAGGSGLTRDQKIALAFGVAGAAAAGYVAYSAYRTRPSLYDEDGYRKPKAKSMGDHYDVSGLKDGPISNKPLGTLGDEFEAGRLKRPDDLMIDTSRGYADFRPKDGFPNQFVADRHADLIATFEEMREKYPSVKNLNVEVLPMSQVQGMEGAMDGAIAAVMPMGRGELRLMYNDRMEGFGAKTKAEIDATERHVPGMFKDKYVGYHEMGHVLAVAHGDMPPADRLLSGKASLSEQLRYGTTARQRHEDTFARHGFSFRELSKLGQYAASQPAESMAELFGHYIHPEMRSRLTPDQLTRAEKMFNEMGGVKEDDA